MKTLLSLALLLLATTAGATNDNDHHNVTCTEDGTPIDVTTVCMNTVSANPEAYCGSYASAEAEAQALAICGDATAFCKAGPAFAMSAVKNACTQSQEQSNVASAVCGETALSVSTTLTCPKPEPCPDVEIGTKVIRCKKIVERPDGRIIRKGCLVTTGAY